MPHLKEYVRHRLIGTPFDPLARGFRRQITLWQSRNHSEIRDALLEDDLLHRVVDQCVTDGVNCVDIGAHLGAMTQLFCDRSPSGKHLAVEPTPYKAAWLRSKFRDVTIVAAALAEQPGEVKFFHQVNNSGYSGLTKHDAHLNDLTKIEEFTVPCETLDRIVPEDRRIGFMKIDVEGAEIRVLNGAKRLLERDRPTFIFECTETGLASASAEVGTLYDLLDEARYDVHTPRGYLERSSRLDRDALDRSIRYPFAAFSFIAKSPGVNPAAVSAILACSQGVAQFGRASGLGPEGRRFKSCHPESCLKSCRFYYL